MILLFLAWGSFLNVVAYRLIRGESLFFPRSHCPSCKCIIAWYDNIPLVSFFLLHGRCRSCSAAISLLYPAIEAFTVLILTALIYHVEPSYWLAYGIFFSALIVTIRTDLETMLISRYVTLYAMPLGWLASAMQALPIPWWASIAGSLFGFLFLYTIAKGFTLLTGKEGMGMGDVELLAFIGAFIGPFGCWITLIIGSTLGALCGITYMIKVGHTAGIKIPFGPFLAIGAITYTLYSNFFISFFL